MKKTIIFLILITMIIGILISNSVRVLGYQGIDTDISIGGTDKDESSKKITGIILGRIQVVGSVISVVALLIIGLRYMFSSLEEKANMKGVLIYYIVGCILVFATSNILGIVYEIFEGLTM